MEILKDVRASAFARTVWVSAEARDMWEKSLREVSAFVSDLEILITKKGLRKATWQTIKKDRLIDFTEEMLNAGLFVTPLFYVGNWQGYSHRLVKYRKGDKDFNVSVVVTKDIEIAREYAKAFKSGDHETQGKFLNFPECCRKFFSENFGDNPDPVFQAAENTKNSAFHSSFDDNLIQVRGHPYSNPVLRYIGLRTSFHIPCSFNCEATIKVAQETMDLAEKTNKAMATLLKSLLSMPMTWDVNHGIAVIKTPIFYVITNTVPTAERYIIEVEGTFRPRESARGVNFPFLKGGANA